MTHNKKQLGKGIKVVILLGVISILLGVTVLGLRAHYHKLEQRRTEQMVTELAKSGYYSVRETMLACGYQEVDGSNYVFVKENTDLLGREIKVSYDFTGGKCTKNSNSFNIEKETFIHQGEYYIERELIEAITNYTIDYSSDEREGQAEPLEFAQHEWTTAFAPLVAHAGGGLRKEKTNIGYPNCLESLIQNYELGHRVFEFDFQMTTDGGLAVIHNGHAEGDKSGVFFTKEEWREYETDPGIQGILVEDILDFMSDNKDVFLVTDTKWVEDKAFKVIRDEALKRDPALLDRVIPQIYNISMYDMVMGVYDFSSIIFTTYATKETNEEVIDFINQHDNIKVITTHPKGWRVDAGFITAANENDILVYTHTLNNYKDIAAQRKLGVHGLYTDYLTPADFEEYYSSY